jgi:hypothetical protein
VTAVAGRRFAWNSGPDLYMLTGHRWRVSLTRARFLPGRVRNGHARRGARYQWLPVADPQRRHQLEPGHRLTGARYGPWPAHPGSVVSYSQTSLTCVNRVRGSARILCAVWPTHSGIDSRP